MSKSAFKFLFMEPAAKWKGTEYKKYTSINLQIIQFYTIQSGISLSLGDKKFENLAFKI